MDATKLMMACVVGIGGFALYRMSKASASSPQTTAPPVPLAPGQTRPTGEGLPYLSDPLSLKQGQWYRGRLQLPAEAVGPFSRASNAPELQAALAALGFATNASLFMSESELPADWPQTALAGANDRSRWFYAMWNLPSVKLPRPAAIELMWASPSPALAEKYATQKSTVSGWFG